MASETPRRSVLYVPALHERALAKLPQLAADVVILDLEDSVAPAEKDAARARAAALLAAPRAAGGPELVVRINRPDEAAGATDLAAILPAAPDGILLPKARSEQDLSALRRQAAAIAPAAPTRLWVMIETAQAVAAPLPLALAQSDSLPLTAFVLGLNDLAAETGVRLMPGRAAMMPWMMMALAAARAGGLDIIDAVFNGITDQEGFAAECASAHDLGFDGKSLIHPTQIEAANRLFAPDEGALAEASRIATVFERPENRQKGVVMVEGRMVERLHAEAAKRLLIRAETIARRRG